MDPLHSPKEPKGMNTVKRNSERRIPRKSSQESFLLAEQSKFDPAIGVSFENVDVLA